MKKVNIGIPAKVYHKWNSYPEVPSSPPHQAQSSDSWTTKIENLEMWIIQKLDKILN